MHNILYYYYVGLILFLNRTKLNGNNLALVIHNLQDNVIEDDRFIRLNVDKDCELKTFIEESEYTFHRGAAFYEFTREEEDIEDDKEVILMDKV